MPNLHVIIGDPDTRKSSLMRCLTWALPWPSLLELEWSPWRPVVRSLQMRLP